MVARLVQAHNIGLAALQEAAMDYFQAHALTFHKKGMATLDDLKQRPDLHDFSIDITKTLVSSVAAASVAEEKARAAEALG